MNPDDNRDFFALEIISGNLKFRINRGNNTETRSVSSYAVNDGSKHQVNFTVNETGVLISMNSTSVIQVLGPPPAHLSGPLYLGGVENWTPAIKDDLSTDQSFYGCFEVGFMFSSLHAQTINISRTDFLLDCCITT